MLFSEHMSIAEYISYCSLMWFKYIRENEGEIKNGQSRETCNNGYARGKTKKKAQHKYIWEIRVITKLPNSEQSYEGKVKTHKYINRQNQSATGKLWKP